MAALTPVLAVAYLRELSADLRAAVVLDAGGRRLAGPEALAAPAAAVTAALAAGETGEAVGPGGAVLAARGARTAIVAVCGRHVLPGLARHDLRLALGDLEGVTGAAAASHVRELPATAVSALLSAAQSAGSAP